MSFPTACFSTLNHTESKFVQRYLKINLLSLMHLKKKNGFPLRAIGCTKKETKQKTLTAMLNISAKTIFGVLYEITLICVILYYKHNILYRMI